MNIPKELTTITPLSRSIAIVLVYILPVIGFFLGIRYHEWQSSYMNSFASQASPDVVQYPTPTQKTYQAKLPFIVVDLKGGLCAPNKPCVTTIALYKSGDMVSPNEKTQKVDKELIKKLEQLVNAADFAKIRRNKFTGVCPTAYDGTETTYTLYTSYGVEVIKSCEVKIDPDSELFSAINKAILQN